MFFDALTGIINAFAWSFTVDVVLNGHFWHIITSHCWMVLRVSLQRLSLCKNLQKLCSLHACLLNSRNLQRRLWLCCLWHVAFTEKRKSNLWANLLFPECRAHLNTALPKTFLFIWTFDLMKESTLSSSSSLFGYPICALLHLFSASFNRQNSALQNFDSSLWAGAS